MEYVKYDEFAKMDIRAATVLSAKEHPNASKLYVLEIDFGDEKRQLVAGLREHYKAEEIVGKQIVVLKNLEPRVLRGIESRGMLLAAGDGEKIRLLTVDEPVKNNAKIS